MQYSEVHYSISKHLRRLVKLTNPILILTNLYYILVCCCLPLNLLFLTNFIPLHVRSLLSKQRKIFSKRMHTYYVVTITKSPYHVFGHVMLVAFFSIEKQHMFFEAAHSLQTP